MSELYIDYFGLKARGVKYTRVHLRRMMRAGQFPLARQLSANRIAWIASEVDAWVTARPIVMPKPKANSTSGSARPVLDNKPRRRAKP